MSDSSQTELSFLKEVTWGVNPGGNSTDLPFDSESLKQTTGTRTSNQIRSDRQVKDITRIQVDAAGDISFTAQFAAHDALLEGVMMDAFATDISVAFTDAVTIAATASGFTDSGNGFVTAGIVVGQWLKFSGFADNTIDGFYRVDTVAAGVIATTSVPPATEVAGASVTIKGSLLKNGTTFTSFLLEKQFVDIAEFLSYPGMVAGQLQLNIPSNEAITGVVSFQGKSEAGAGASVTAGLDAAPTNDEFNSIDNIKDVRFNGAASMLDLTEITLSLENNLRPRPAIGNVGPVGMGLGRINVSGTLKAYFESRTEMELYRDFTEVNGLSWRTEDAAGNAYVFDLGKLRITDAQQVAGGNDQDVIAELTFEAYRDALSGFTAAINRFVA